MTVHFIICYDVQDPEAYARYNPGALPAIGQVLARHGGRVVAASGEAQWLGDSGRDVVVLLEFPTTEAAHAWHDDPDYAPHRAVREASTKNTLACVVEAMQMPG